MQTNTFAWSFYPWLWISQPSNPLAFSTTKRAQMVCCTDSNQHTNSSTNVPLPHPSLPLPVQDLVLEHWSFLLGPLLLPADVCGKGPGTSSCWSSLTCPSAPGSQWFCFHLNKKKLKQNRNTAIETDAHRQPIMLVQGKDLALWHTWRNTERKKKQKKKNEKKNGGGWGWG